MSNTPADEGIAASRADAANARMIRPFGKYLDSLMVLEGELLVLERHGKKTAIRSRAKKVLDHLDDAMRALERLRDAMSNE